MYKQFYKYTHQAADLDSSDVVLWYHIGCVAKDLDERSIARYAFEQGNERTIFLPVYLFWMEFSPFHGLYPPLSL